MYNSYGSWRLVPDRKGAIWEDRLSSIILDKYISVSEELTEYLASEIKINRKKLQTIVNGVDTQRFSPVDNTKIEMMKDGLSLGKADKIIGTVCRLDPIKNLDFLLECFPSILSSIPNCKIIIVGDGPSKGHLIKRAQELGLNNRVIFLGQRNDIENVMPVIDIYVSTSLSEGTSMTILEAMSCCIPIVASAVGGNTKLVDSSNGHLFPLNDADKFSKGIIKY